MLEVKSDNSPCSVCCPLHQAHLGVGDGDGHRVPRLQPRRLRVRLHVHKVNIHKQSTYCKLHVAQHEYCYVLQTFSFSHFLQIFESQVKFIFNKVSRNSFQFPAANCFKPASSLMKGKGVKVNLVDQTILDGLVPGTWPE